MSPKRLLALLAVLVVLPLAASEESEFGWPNLTDFEWVEAGFNTGLRFGDRVKPYDGKVVELNGYIVPLDVATDTTQHFLLSRTPIKHCHRCQLKGPASTVEIFLKEPVEASKDEVIVRGKLELLADDLGDIIYRMKQAETVAATP
ncbi:MAG: hypothetical protein GY716_12985 [bacterium]|nr:hypothetical protein [bacterium]